MRKYLDNMQLVDRVLNFKNLLSKITTEFFIFIFIII